MATTGRHLVDTDHQNPTDYELVRRELRSPSVAYISATLRHSIGNMVVSQIRPTRRMFAFALGFPVGLIAAILIIFGLSTITTIAAPVALLLTVSATLATALLFTLLPIGGDFTTREERILERAQYLHHLRMAALEKLGEDMRAQGIPIDELQEILSAKAKEVLDLYLEVLSGLQDDSKTQRSESHEG